jgi:hypothetical protein
MKLPGKKKIVRIQISGAINTTIETSDAGATKKMKELADLQELKIMEAIGEARWKEYLRECQNVQKNPGSNNFPSKPYGEHPFPLTIKIS